MLKAGVIYVGIFAAIVGVVVSTPEQVNPGEPLFLTPLIEGGRLQEARDASKVTGLPINNGGDIESYSGFITVDSTYNSNVFFWYFLARNGDPNAPVVLWLEGGPAESVQTAIFIENGPFTITDDMTLTLKETSWAQTHSMIYIESPIGTGFSFLDDTAGLDTNVNQTSANSYTFLTQFFQLFPDAQTNDFYIGGVSYGGKFATGLAYKIHTENQGSPQIRINLKGIVAEAPWIDPVNQVLIAEYLFHLGFIDQTTHDEMEAEQLEIQDLIAANQYTDALIKWDNLTIAPDSLFVRATNMTTRALYNFYSDVADPTTGYFIDFVNLPEIRQAIHVGNAGYSYYNGTVGEAYSGDFMVSYRPLLETLLNAPEGYRVVIYPAQLDILVGYKGVENMLAQLDWSGKQEFSSAVRTSWKVGDYVAGFAKTARNLTYILVRNAGHSVSHDQPAWTADLIQRVSSGTPF